MNAADAHAQVAALTGRRTMTEREINRAGFQHNLPERTIMLALAYRDAAIAARSYR